MNQKAKGSVYIIWLNNGQYYIGSTINIKTRVPQHKRDKEFDFFSEIEVTRDDVDDLQMAIYTLEMSLIEKYRDIKKDPLCISKEGIPRYITTETTDIDIFALEKISINKYIGAGITNVIMKRELFGKVISQRSENEFFSATDLVKAGNKWRMLNELQPFDVTAYFKQKGTIEFIKELELKFGKVKISGRGRGNHTWVHPFIFIDLALAIDPKLKIEVYGWLFDYLIQNRNNSGDSYKRMCGALYTHTTKKSQFSVEIKKLAKIIKFECGTNDWSLANEHQLKLRDKIQENIALLSEVLKDNNSAIRLGIINAKKLLDNEVQNGN